MSESIVRKVQPFTIGTRLSVPTVPKCPDFTQSYLQHQTLDNCTALQHNLNDRMSLYLSCSQVCLEGLVSPLARRVTPVKRQQEDMAAEDHLNQNVVSPSGVSRSIKKITISGSREESGERVTVVGPARLPIRVSKSVNNNNNNNTTTITAPSNPQLPRIVGVSCENKPSSHFKVLLRKDSNDEQQPIPGQTRLQWNREISIQQISVPKKETQRRENQAHTQHDGPTMAASQSDCFTQRNSLFNKEILQAEAWIQGKLQDLKDGCNVQRCPLQDWEEFSQTLHRDLKDFENTLIQLNQMGEQLISKLNPTSDLVKRQLSQLRDQWQTLKQTAANQSRALGGAKSFQEFNKKVDKLEAWIKEKQEEEQSLVSVLGENTDKMQLTRKILDLKQDEQLYRHIHEEINHLALKLEKQGKTDGKNISTKRKHINKMWLKVQSHLKKYHENLQLALEVSSFYQQADNTLFAINNMRKSISASKDLLAYGDREIRDIASQIMMLDVTVSQLSNLHPALASCVTQKHSELKDSWTLLQKAFRTDRPAPPPAGSTFTREEADPLTPAREQQCGMGTEPHRIMGKEVKEEQNRLKGCVIVRDCESSGRLQSSQSSEQQQSAASHTSPIPLGDGPAHLADVMGRCHQSQGESRKQRAEPKPAAACPRGHPPIHAQLHKFTVSADKTLSWLKDNVAMATQVCSMAGVEGPEAARRCQDALEQEILANRARMEVVKKEGRGLVRAQHPGSAKIEQFLGQLEVLWEELKRRHQRNAVFLQASEQLGFRAVRVLQALGSLEAWLESVELSMRESSLAGDPETMSVAERESCLLQREVSARGLELSALKQEVERLRGQSHPHTQRLPARMEEVDRKYQRVQSALTQQSSELQDTRMLTEFLERVELEESQDLSGNHFSLGQPLHSDISSAPPLLGFQGSGGGVPLMESMGDPVEELREAVEMLNDTVRERGRAQNHDQAIQELISRHARLAVGVEECLRCCKELSLDMLERETDMAIKCEPDRCGLEGLQERHDHLEIDYEAMKEEVKEMESRASRLEELCPERVHILWAKIQASLQAWRELGGSVVDNRGRLREFVQLQEFFRSYLAMISWTEDTRSCIFSEAALHFGKDGREPLAAELDVQIEQKFEEFDELAAAGRKLLNTEHHLAEMVRERMEELRSMLGWILVHWRAQKQQWLLKMKREEPSRENIYSEEPSQENICSEEPSQGNIYCEEPSQGNMYFEELSQENIYSEASACSPVTENSTPEPQSPQSLQSLQSPACVSVCEDQLSVWAAADSLSSAPVSTRQEEPGEEEEERSEDGYEVMSSMEQRGGEKSPFLVLKEPSATALGGTVNLILSFGNSGDSHVQVLEPPSRMEEEEEEEEVETSEPVHRVSTYLHVKDNNMAPVYESITLPRPNTRSAASASSPSSPSSSSSPPPPPPSSSSSAPAAHPASVSFHSLTRSGSSSIFSSLKRMSKKRKRKRDARRHTIQRIMGVEEQAEEGTEPHYACESIAYDTRTWPLKEARRMKKSSLMKSPADGAGVPAYVKNPLLKDIETECSGEYSITPYAVSEGPSASSSAGPMRSHCRFLSLGSVLSFDLPRDMSLIPSIQDIITIGPPESKKGGGTHPDPHSQRHTALSSFKQTRPPAGFSHSPVEVSSTPGYPETQTAMVVVKDLPDMDEVPLPTPPPSLDEEEDQTVPCDDLSKVQFSCSGIVSLHEEPELNASTGYVELEASSQHAKLPKDSPVLVNQNHCPTAVTHNQEYVSTHTLIQDLNGHHKNTKPQSAHRESPVLQWSQCSSQASHMVVNLKSTVSVTVREDSVDSGISSSGSFKLCTEAPHPRTPDNPQPRGVVGRLMSLELGGIDCTKPRVNPPASLGPSPASFSGSGEPDTDPVHPDHQQFEEEEEELEDIWNRTNGYRRSICSDIMYQPHQEEAGPPPDQPRETSSPSPSPKPQAVLYRKLTTASEPNLLVAEFRLPSPIQSLLGYNQEQSPKEQLPPLARGERRSWAAFPNRDQQLCKPSSMVNETASDPVKLPDIEDSQRYIYQYKEEEEEEEEEDTGCVKDQSMSLLSVHMGLDRAGQRGMTSGSVEDMEEQGQQMTTGGRCNTVSGKPELQSMEGTLERKHKLQLGGKKASCRAWSSYHAVLYRQTLCFYQDRKDTLRSCACGLPLNLTGAECVPTPEYTKKANCFSLRLRDGSEYLLSASSRFMMKKWMLKIQANTGIRESVPSMLSGPVIQELPAALTSPSLCPSCHGLDRCHCPSRHDVTSTFPRCRPAGSARGKEIVVLTRDCSQVPQGHLSRLAEQTPTSPSDTGGCDGDFGLLRQSVAQRLSGGTRDIRPLSPQSSVCGGQDWLSNKPRSHSFTSATYQRIKPLTRQPPAGRGPEVGSSYSVTLVIGDKSSDSPSTTRHTEAPLLSMAGWQPDTYHQDSALRSYASLPRPRNKSVFKKFFGKKQ